MHVDIQGRIAQLDLSNIKTRLVQKLGWSEDRAVQAIAGYREFLLISSTAGTLPSPELDVDEVWHAHILHTQQYREDCNSVFGSFLDHTPEYPVESTLSTVATKASALCIATRNKALCVATKTAKALCVATRVKVG